MQLPTVLKCVLPTFWVIDVEAMLGPNAEAMPVRKSRKSSSLLLEGITQPGSSAAVRQSSLNRTVTAAD